MLKLPTGVGRPWVLCDERLVLAAVKDLRARADDDPVRLRIPAVAGVAGRIENIRAVRVVQDRSPAIIAAVRIRFCEAKFPVPSTCATTRENCLIDGIGRINHSRVLEFETSSASIGAR